MNIYNFLTFGMCSALLTQPIKKILNANWNILDICCVSFYIVQIMPIFFKTIFGISETLKMYPKMYDAMMDTKTQIIYNVFVVLAFLILILLAKSALPSNQKIIINKIKKLKKNRKWMYISQFGMFSILLGAILSPKPQIYFSFSYFYTHSYSKDSEIYIYHKTTMAYLTLLTFLFIFVFYYYNDNKKKKIYAYLAIILMAWINGKRTMTILSLIGILFIDIIKKEYNKKIYKFIIKIMFFAGIILWYFIFYGEETGKMASLPFNHLYSIYFARMSNVEVSIYDKLYDNEMMDYTGQSVLYDLFFWIPRLIWKNKPVLYSKYHTAYIMGYNDVFTNWQFQTNIWSEYISNFSFCGIFLAIVVIYIISTISGKSKNIIVFFSGMLFAVLYTMYGFESIVQYIGIFWVIAAIISKFKIKL